MMILQRIHESIFSFKDCSSKVGSLRRSLFRRLRQSVNVERELIHIIRSVS